MKMLTTFRKHIVGAVVGVGLLAFPVQADPVMQADSPLDDLFTELADPANENWRRAESDIQREWSKSGSATVDLLLKRGQEAMEAGDFAGAIGHLTALTDHAPEFPEGWNARATAYYLAGYFGPSIQDIRVTLALEPRHYGALSGLGIILEELGDTEAALRAYRAAHEIHPHQQNVNAAIARLELALEGTEL